jgi:hypothetical protein
LEPGKLLQDTFLVQFQVVKPAVQAAVQVNEEYLPAVQLESSVRRGYPKPERTTENKKKK